MFRFFVVCCIAAIFAVNGAKIPEAAPGQWEGRIVGGTAAFLGQFPYQVSLRSMQNSHFCGGFIISNRWLGSAAHCTAPRTIGNTRAVVGAIHRSTGGVTHNLARFINHPNYQAQTLENDVSLIQTMNSIVFNNMVAPVALGSTFIGGGANAVATGFGQTGRNGPSSTGLLWVGLRTITNDECRRKFSSANAQRILDSIICTFTRVGQGTCMGDSGGPLVSNGNVIGIVSWGIPCASGSPDVYTRVSSYRAWMMSQML
ncbi:chymotrypsin-2-like isoform X2 [Chironomus tepperi]|uniref:chymotrypsin-2-like isoform X2 n=1 Tax=Chironomus tepperi TaxID=113505 RepID=UPI00391F8B1C